MSKASLKSKQPANKQKNSTVMKSVKKEQKDEEALFLAGTIVCILSNDDQTDFYLVKVLEDVYESSNIIQVLYLEEIKDKNTNKNHVFKESTHDSISTRNIIVDLEDYNVINVSKRGNTSGQRYEIPSKLYNKLKILAKNFRRVLSDYEGESSNKEEEESSTEKKPTRSKSKKRKVVAVRANHKSPITRAKSVDESEDNEESEKEEVRTPIKRGVRTRSALKSESVKRKASSKTKKEKPKLAEISSESNENQKKIGITKNKEQSSHKKVNIVSSRKKVIKKQKISVDSKKITMVEDIEESIESDIELEDGESEEEDVEKVDNQNEKTSKVSKKAKSQKFSKGKFNPNVEFIEYCDMLESKNNNPIDYGSIKSNNKNIIRAAYTKNHQLLKKILESEYLVSSHNDSWGPETNFNALQLIFKNKDKNALKMVIQSNKFAQKLAANPRCGLKRVSTGYNSIYAFGVRVRKVNVARGGREGNNAFVADLESPSLFDGNTLQKICEMDVDLEMIDMLRAEIDDNELDNLVPYVIRAGNFKLAGALVSNIIKRGGFGFNFLHEDVLTKNDPGQLKPFKKVSCSKKTNLGECVITPIHCAAINPNPKILEALLDVLPEYSITDERMRKPIHYAAACEGPGPIELLIKKGVDTREGDQLKNTPLMYACYYGRTQNVEVLLSAPERSNIAAKNRDGMMAIHLAAIQGHLDILKILQKKGADLNAPGKARMTAIHFAAAYGHFECLKFLHENGGKILAKDKLRRSPLILASKNGNLKIVSYLLVNGAEFNQADSSKNYAIHYAAAYGYPEIIEILIKSGANQNVMNSWNISPLTLAMLKNNFDCVKKLLSYPNTDVNCKNDEGRTIVSSAIDTISNKSYEHIKFLIVEKKADLNIPDTEGYTALHYACKLDKSDVSKRYPDWRYLSEAEKQKLEDEHHKLILDLVNLLIDNGANINQKTEKGLTPFEAALENDGFDIVNLLLSKKELDLLIANKNDQGIYHFFSKAIKHDEGIKIFNRILEIVQNKNDFINLIDSNGFTPLLLYVKDFSAYARELLNEYYETTKEAELENKKIKWVNENETTIKTSKAENIKIEDSTTANDNHLFGLFNNTKTFSKTKRVAKTKKIDKKDKYNSQKNPDIVLTEAEDGECRKKAEVLFDRYIDLFLEILGQLLALSANPQQTVQKLKEYRNKKDNEDGETIEEKHSKYIAKMAKKKAYGAKAPKKQINEKTNKESHYGPCGLQSMFHLIQGYPHPRLLEFALQLGLDINQQDDCKRTPLHLFIEYNNTELGITHSMKTEDILEILCSQKADPNIPDYKKDYPLLKAVMSNKFYFLPILKKYGANFDVINNDGVTPLIFTVKENKLENTENLLELGANVNFRDNMDRTPLHHAVNCSKSCSDASFEMESLLLRFGADVNALDRRMRTPLFYAFVKIGNSFDYSHIDPVETVTSLCLAAGCDVQIKDVWGYTPLHYAAQRGAHICGLYLINSGAEINAINEDGNTPLAVAMLAGHFNIAIMLIQTKADVNKRCIVKIKKNSKKKSNSMITEDESSNDDSKESEVEEEEEDRGYNSNGYNYNGYNNYNNYNFGGYNQYNPFNNNNNNNLKEGDYSMFTIAIKKDWQGVAYLILQNGYDLMKALMDAMNEKKFQYVLTLLRKASKPEILWKENDQKQNLYHIFALRGAEASNELAIKINKEFKLKKIDYHSVDIHGRTPLHYAAESNYQYLIKELLSYGIDPNILDKNYHSAFSILLSCHTITEDIIKLFIGYNTNIAQKFQCKVRDKNLLMGPLCYLASKGNKSFNIYKQLIQNGVSINETDEEGFSSLIYAIRENSKKIVKFLLESPEVDKKQVDFKGRTPIHHVVNPLEYGSYENIEMLEMLANYFDINQTDNEGRSPIFYAYLQDSGRMVQKLKDLGAIDTRPSILKRAATSIISGIDWPENEIDFEEDAETFIKKREEEEDNKMVSEDEKIQPDDQASNRQTTEVVYDDRLGPYNLIMTKVDIKKGGYSENLFYRMQVLHEKNRDVYILFTRWGRIGDFGQFQQTPFGTKEDCINEFKKIFKEKSGNLWEDKDNFQKMPKKYQLMKFERRINYKDYLVPLDLKNPNIPKSSLSKETKQIIKDISSVKMYQKWMDHFNIDREFLPIAKLSKNILLEAKHLLLDIAELLDELDNQYAVNASERSNDDILRMKEEIADKSSRFYELIPISSYRSQPIPPINNKHILKEKSNMIEGLIDIEVASKILLGSLHNAFKINPLDYIYTTLNVKMLPLPKESPEYQIILNYSKNGCSNYQEGYIKNVFALERKGESERFSPWNNLKNRMLLWHGSKISNFLGILSQGLRIAPPEAPSTGFMFGKGIYFADRFEKSVGYCNDWTTTEGQDYYILLLCEVALGNMYELYESESITQLKVPYNSTKGIGQIGPNFKHSIFLSNGCMVPLGKNINYADKERKKGINDPNITRNLFYNEYIVYDISQVRIRYMVQVKKSQ